MRRLNHIFFGSMVQCNAREAEVDEMDAEVDNAWLGVQDRINHDVVGLQVAMDEFILLKLFRKALHLCCMNRIFRELKALIGNPS